MPPKSPAHIHTKTHTFKILPQWFGGVPGRHLLLPEGKGYISGCEASQLPNHSCRSAGDHGDDPCSPPKSDSAVSAAEVEEISSQGHGAALSHLPRSLSAPVFVGLGGGARLCNITSIFV